MIVVVLEENILIKIIRVTITRLINEESMCLWYLDMRENALYQIYRESKVVKIKSYTTIALFLTEDIDALFTKNTRSTISNSLFYTVRTLRDSLHTLQSKLNDRKYKYLQGHHLHDFLKDLLGEASNA